MTILQQILAYPLWRQCIELENGYSTTGRVNKKLWKGLHFPDDVKGKSFLDIGANDGLFSFMAEKKGANPIVASDLYKDSIGSMEDGWSNEGIELLKTYFNSNITIHKNGIYHLSELNRQFDIVLVNHIINWLDDIELAIKNLALATKGSVYISDGFLLEKNTKEFIEPKNMPIRFLYKSSYIATLLRKNGFKVDDITEINYQPFFISDFINFPNIEIKDNTKVYKLPDANSDYQLMNVAKTISYAHIGDFYHVFNIGWVHKNDVSVVHYKPSLAYKISNALGLKKIYYAFLNYKFKKKNEYTYCVIKATKIN